MGSIIILIIILFLLIFKFKFNNNKRIFPNYFPIFNNKLNPTSVMTRVQYYIHRVELQPYFYINSNILDKDNLNKQTPFLYKNLVLHSNLPMSSLSKNSYWLKFINDMNECLSTSNELKLYEFVTHFSDWNFETIPDYNIPTICKVATICNQSPCTNQFITLPLEQDSLFNNKSFIINGFIEDDIPFYEKTNKLVWRGTNSGIYKHSYCKSSRYNLVKLYNTNSECDIGFTNIHTPYIPKYIEEEYFNYNYIEKKELLKQRCIISIEGNDRASNIYWALLSNSAVITTRSSTRSWFMEELLTPWVHYIPVKPDWSDLIEKWKWSCKYPEKTFKIAKNGQQFMKQFSNLNHEKQIIKHILLWYGNNVKFKIPKDIQEQLYNYKNMIK